MPSIRLPRALLPCALPALAACSTVAGADRAVAMGRPFDLHPGDQAVLAGGGTLRYVGLVNDSRCAPDVQCIWAGDAEIALEWAAPASAAARFSLHTTPGRNGNALGAGRVLRLLALQRGAAPVATLQVDAAP